MQFLKLITNYKLLITIFLLFAFISIFFAISIGLAIYSFVRLLLLVLTAFSVAYLLKDRKVFKTTLAIIAILAVLQSGIGFLQFLNQENLGLQFLGESPISITDGGTSKIIIENTNVIRAYGTFPHPNILSAFLLLGLFSLYYLWLRNGPRNGLRNGLRNTKSRRITKEVIFPVAIFIVALGLALAFSRTAWAIGILLTFIFLVYLFLDKNYRRQGLRLTFAIVISCLLLVVSFGRFIFPRASVSLDEPAVSQRFTYNDLGIDLIKSNTLGVGIGNQVFYSVENNIYQKFGMGKVWQWQPIHNLYLLVGAEIGVLGLAAFLIFIASLLISNFQFTISNKITNSNYQNSGKLALVTSYCLLVTLLLFGLFDHFLWTIWQGQLMFWLVIGFLLVKNSKEVS